MDARVAVGLVAVALVSCAAEESRDEVSSALVPAKACAHDPCATGAKLAKTCNACVGSICAQDSYCCATNWDQQCVHEAGSVCGQSCGGAGGSGGGGDGSGDLLKFAVFGDCRPPYNNQTGAYPSAIIGGIFSRAQDNGAQFVIGTGDYMFASTAKAVNAQVALFQQAMANYSAGPVYLTMGNHECTGATASNCPQLTETPNVQAFMQLVPSGVTRPYYRVDVSTPFGTAKLVFIAANAWDSTQEDWLTTQLADPTAYTFVMRHEPIESSGVPASVKTSEAIVRSQPYTLELLGHSHEYQHVDARHVISGNAGAPLQTGSGSSYGLLVVEQRADGNIAVSEIDQATGNVTDTFTVSPSGDPI